jgi:hypothetical protein
LPELAKAINGRSYGLDANPLDIKSFTLTFPGAAEAQLALDLSDRRDGPRAVGLDGVPRVSLNGRFGLPVALSATWESSNTLVLSYDEIGNINTYRFRLAFSNGGVDVQFSERSGAVRTTRFAGKLRNH